MDTPPLSTFKYSFGTSKFHRLIRDPILTYIPIFRYSYIIRVVNLQCHFHIIGICRDSACH